MVPFLAQIQTYGFNFAPRGWTLCNGQLLPISQNTAVFSLVGTTYGGDGRTTFGVPDLRGRSMVGVGSGPGLQHRSWGQRGGANFVNITMNQMPAHSHTLRAFDGIGDSRAPGGDLIATSENGDKNFNKTANPNATMNTASIGTSGANQAVTLDNPYLSIYIAFSLEGVFPSRS